MNRKNTKKDELTYIPLGDETALNTKVEELGLHPKTIELFVKNNILTVYDIARRNSKQLFKIQGFGKKDLIGVERELGKLNITLAPLPEEAKSADDAENVKTEEKPEKKESKKQDKKPERKEPRVLENGDTPIQEMGFTPRTYNSLNRGRLLSAFDLASKTEKDLIKVRNLGQKGVDEVKEKLLGLGLKLKEESVEEVKKEQPKKEVQKKEAVKKDVPKKETPKKEQPVKKEPKTPQPAKQNQTPVKQQKNPNNKKSNDNEYKRISQGEKFGIGKGNEVIIPAEYDEVFMVKEDMVCVDVDGLFGYVNLNNEMVIEPKYELAQSFSRGLANVMLNDKYGYIDKKGNVVIDFQYELATPFEDDDTARVKLDGRWGSIDKEGKITWI